MTLIKTSLLNGIAVIIKMLTLLGLNKILAIYVGPSGYAALGQFQNVVQMITTFASGAINTGVTKYTAEHFDDEVRQHAVWHTAGTIALIGSLSSAALVVAFNRSLAGWALKDETLGSVFIWFAATLVLFVFNTLLLAILNGKKEIQRYVIANIAGSLLALAVTSFMAIQFGLYGALVALAIYQSLTFFVTLLMTYKAPWFKFVYLVGGIDKSAAKDLSKYAAMAIFSAILAPFSHTLIRNHLGETLSWDAAGYWEAMWRLSGAYLMLVTTTLGIYYLPRLSELQNSADIRQEIIQGYKLILPITAFFGVILYVSRGLVTKVLFSIEFQEMEVLFAWQIIGDILKIASWILSFLMLAKAMTKLFLLTQVFFHSGFYLLTVLFTPIYGLQGVAIAHASCYFIFFIFLYILVFKKLK
ncbi:O-antigen translocase [uncultured Marinobacter sp.]|uniref:O-antigen translocase n=1 Tax=uncultured Marinobacter sp. TaxID=187379 RepID=UPI00261975A1|nr:O-antigen translocase [uncultured Marinobacter sp.]